jgi:hypothetical protein
MIEVRPLLAVTAVAALALPAGVFRRHPHQGHLAVQDLQVPVHVVATGQPDGVQLPRRPRPSVRRVAAAGHPGAPAAFREGHAHRSRSGAQLHRRRRLARRAGFLRLPGQGRIATGSAGVWTGPGPLLDLTMNVFATGPRGIVATLDSNGNVLRVLCGTLRGTQLIVAVPSITVGGGTAALAKVDLTISGGSAKRPTFTTPETCPRGGWPVTYAPLFASLGRRTLVDVSKCRA